MLNATISNGGEVTAAENGLMAAAFDALKCFPNSACPSNGGGIGSWAQQSPGIGQPPPPYGLDPYAAFSAYGNMMSSPYFAASTAAAAANAGPVYGNAVGPEQAMAIYEQQQRQGAFGPVKIECPTEMGGLLNGRSMDEQQQQQQQHGLLPAGGQPNLQPAVGGGIGPSPLDLQALSFLRWSGPVDPTMTAAMLKSDPNTMAAATAAAQMQANWPASLWGGHPGLADQ